ncbi:MULTISPECIES: FusB/FusC family EF-G-binding protein [Sporosarcina]|uniref:FusB/FusC family EF-G-binding protein n=1 Tax=Sporosarcina TaxID=1569 RepID=UPI00129B9B75|nr:MULTISPECIES: FusB/FusC family EF-G-binding protein [Sporosarcina]GKV64249.1 elongation factor G-binding protein [Sporosarcina sp. NCCP-2331]GLB54287.1 elongation factor G-binding protein [Sporosarcina sp. NCCP-2378]
MKSEQFIRNDQFNFIKRQVLQLVSGHATVNDQHVINAMESLAIEKTEDLFTGLTPIQRNILNRIVKVADKETAEQYLVEIEAYIIPFKELSEQKLQKLFPKVKKMKLPKERLNYNRMSFLSYDDFGTKRRYIVVPARKGMIGLTGTYEETKTKQICAICNRLTPVCMFITKTKGDIAGNYTKKGNYICRDSEDCNHHLLSLDKVYEFVENIK